MKKNILSRLSGSKVSHKLYAGFGVVLLLVIIASGLSMQRFKAIRDIYEKTNLIYNINIDVFQVKVNRVKYLYSADEKVRTVMAGFILHASQLTHQAQALSWDQASATGLDDIGRYLTDFKQALDKMGQFSADMVAIRSQLDALDQQNPVVALQRSLDIAPEDSAATASLNTLIMAFFDLKQSSYQLRLHPGDEASAQVQKQYQSAQQAYRDVVAYLTPLQKTQLDPLLRAIEEYQQYGQAFFDRYTALNTAENQVKVAGDNSSAAVKVIINSVKAKNDQLAYGSARMTLLIGLIAVIMGLLVAWYITRLITRPVRRNLAVAERIAGGDLSATIIADSHDELGQLTSAMARMNNELRHIIADVRDSVGTVATSAATIAAGNTDLSSRTEQQAAAVVQTAASMEQLTATVKNNADNARHASQIAGDATQTAYQGGEAMKNVVSTMQDIASSSQKITDITALINSIAFQTNILALNAAVEAARAGEQGRGFAVVASEVRNLSQRSSQAAKEIATLIGESVARIDVGSTLVAEAGETMQHIVSAVSRVNDIMGEISSASEEQSHGIDQIARAISELDTTTQQNAALVTESSIAANTLEDHSVVLEKRVARFQL